MSDTMRSRTTRPIFEPWPEDLFSLVRVRASTDWPSLFWRSPGTIITNNLVNHHIQTRKWLWSYRREDNAKVRWWREGRPCTWKPPWARWARWCLPSRIPWQASPGDVYQNRPSIAEPRHTICSQRMSWPWDTTRSSTTRRTLETTIKAKDDLTIVYISLCADWQWEKNAKR